MRLCARIRVQYNIYKILVYYTGGGGQDTFHTRDDGKIGIEKRQKTTPDMYITIRGYSIISIREVYRTQCTIHIREEIPSPSATPPAGVTPIGQVRR